jgi:pyruvate-formate lyase
MTATAAIATTTAATAAIRPITVEFCTAADYAIGCCLSPAGEGFAGEAPPNLARPIFRCQKGTVHRKIPEKLGCGARNR